MKGIYKIKDSKNTSRICQRIPIPAQISATRFEARIQRGIR